MHCSTFSSSVSVFSSKVSTNNIMSSTFTAPGSSLGGCQGINLPLSLFKPFCRSLKKIHKKLFYLKNKNKQSITQQLVIVYLQQVELSRPDLQRGEEGLKVSLLQADRGGFAFVQS